MKQPQLGKKISELRKAKGLTQEELVEKCNLNVRTIQRIEAGEVTPRSYTVKALFEALDYRWEEVNNGIEREEQKVPSYLYLAFASGLLYFFMAFYEIGMEYEWIEDGFVENRNAFASVKLITFLSYVGFLGGILALVRYFPNRFLKIALWVMIGFNVVFYTMDLISLFTSMLTIQDYYWVKIEAFGLGYAFIGASYFGYKNLKFGISQVIGALGLIAGILIFSGIGLIFGLVPLTFFEIGQLGLMIYFIQKIGRPSAPDFTSKGLPA
ncbi:helix-turn-helix domain-containing protein [Algoriphagus litoralis]|uniref:helix-turn-helix domain-containing protein n=1 Tax=Algoriphagus litoralis TaxID=2202829 RepID=UPI001300A504|nr:helix-turn-helix transcriptional regulator [Algoriphagus litoralis]